MDKINIAIIDNDLDYIRSMSSLLNMESDMFVVGTAKNKEEALKLPEIYNIDFFLLDVDLGENQPSGLEVTGDLLSRSQDKFRVIINTSFDNTNYIHDAFCAGAVHFVDKKDHKKLPDEIRKLHQGQHVIEAIAASTKKMFDDKCFSKLSARELEILKLTKIGLTQSAITDRLEIKQRTLKNMVNRLLKKLQVKSCKEAILRYRSYL